MNPDRLAAHSITIAALVDAEPVLERLPLPDEALANLAVRAGVDEAALRQVDGRWAARVILDDTAVLLYGDGNCWAVYRSPGGDETEALLTARKLHGILGEQGDGWDLDR